MSTILVIDDDGGQRRLLNRTLTLAKHEVVEAGDGVAGLRRFRDENPALVICDIVMPEKEGIETIRDIRALSPGVPIIAISGGGVDIGLNYLDLAQKLGADSILPKPFRPAELVALVEALLGPARRPVHR